MSHKQLTDQELDALVVRSLSRLPAYAPSRGFEAAVMARVMLPQPRPVALYRRAVAWAAEPRRAVALAGSYAALALIALGVVVPWLVSHSPQISFALDWALGRSLALVHQTSAAFAGWTLSSGIAQRVQSLPVSAPAALAAGSLIAAAYAGCAVGLHYLLRTPRGLDATLPAQA
ncbi:MAG: hypothetical protein ACHQU1_00580 [Gemmatimonadales bacterium]